MQKTITRTALFLLFAVLFVSRITWIADPDVFMHIRTGQWILENRTIPRADPFSWSVPGAPWDDHEWLYQVAAWLVYKAGGLVALGLMRAAVLTLALFLLYRLCRLRGAGAGLAAFLTLVAAIGVRPFNEPRPYIVTSLGLVVFGLALEHARQGRRWWLLVPPLYMLFWVNMHAGFTAGCILLLLAFGGTLVESAIGFVSSRIGKKKPNFAGKHSSEKSAAFSAKALLHRYDMRLLLCGAASLIALLANPYGWRILLFPFKLVTHPVLMQVIQEWNPSSIGSDNWMFYVLAFLMGMRLLALRFRVRPSDLGAYVVFTLMALSAIRHTSLFFFILTPVAATWFSSLGLIQRLQTKSLAWKSAGWVALLALALLWTVPTLLHSRVWRFGFQPNPEIFPVQAANLIQKWKPKGKMLNGYNSGGYLIYRLFPEYKVFIDGRADVYGPELNTRYADLLYVHTDWRQQLDAMDVNFVLLDAPLTDRTNLVDALAASPEWALLYWDDTCSLYVRNIPEHQKMIQEQAYYYIHPLKTDENLLKFWETPEAREQGTKELERRMQEGPSCLNVLRNLSFLYGREKRTDKALQLTNAYLQRIPNDAPMLLRKAQILEQTGKTTQAKAAYREVLRLSKKSGYPWTRLGVMAQAANNLKLAEKYYRKSYEAESADPVGTYQYAKLLIQRNRWKEASVVLRDYLKMRGAQKEAWQMLLACYEQMNQPFQADQAAKMLYE